MPAEGGIVEFLAARWDEEEELADMASPAPWRWNYDEGTAGVPPWAILSAGTTSVVIECEGQLVMHRIADAEHIAYWEPARVLADLAAKRAILAAHPADRYSGYCTRCVDRDPESTDNLDAIYPCLTVTLLVQPYRNHPGYDPTWNLDGV